MLERSPWQVALALRWRVWRRRYVSPLEGAALATVSGLALLVGRAAAERLDAALVGAAITAALALLAAAGVGLAARLLFRDRELTLLLTHGLAPRSLVRLRALELTAALAAALIPLLAGAAGYSAARGAAPAAGVAVGLLGLGVALSAPALAGLSLLGAWLAVRVGTAPRVALGVAVATAVALAAWQPGAALVAVRSAGHPLAPGGGVLELASGQVPAGLLLLAGLGAAALLAADRVIPPSFGVSLDRAVPRRRQGSPLPWRLLGALTRPLGRQAGGLLQRDLALLGRGSFVRGLVILAALPLSLGILRLVQQDRQLEGWHLQLIGLLLAGVIGSAAGFLFGVDFPRARRGALVLERTQPLRASAVLLARWVPAALYAGALVLGATALIATAERPQLATQALPFLLKGLLVAGIVSHHAVAYGLRSESQLDPAEAAAYPMNGAVVVLVFALALLLHPLGALGYLLWWGFVAEALRRWEVAEVETLHGAAA